MTNPQRFRDRSCLVRFGDRIRLLREQRNLTQLDLARRAGVHRPYVSELENGRKEPCLIRVCALADALGVSVSQLLRGV